MFWQRNNEYTPLNLVERKTTRKNVFLYVCLFFVLCSFIISIVIVSTLFPSIKSCPYVAITYNGFLLKNLNPKDIKEHTVLYNQITKKNEFAESAPFLYVSKKVLLNTLDSFAVIWHNIPNNEERTISYNDWIGVYLEDNLSDDLWQDKFNVDETENQKSYIINEKTFGSGFISLQVVNTRQQLQFRYFREINGTSTLLARSEVVSFAHQDDEVLQVHVGLANEESSMMITFVTNLTGVPFVEIGDEVYYGEGTHTVTYTEQNLCTFPAKEKYGGWFVPVGNIHTVTVPNLSPSKEYSYRVGVTINKSEKVPLTISKWFKFLSPPKIGPKESTSFAVFGDMGTMAISPGSFFTVETLKKWAETLSIQFVAHFGDLSYAMGRGHVWDLFLTEIEPIASRIPYMVSVGNHEYCYAEPTDGDISGANGNWSGLELLDIGYGIGYHPYWGNFWGDSAGECGIPTAYRFPVPKTGNSVFWYSFDYGSVHIVQLSSEHDLAPGSPQYTWLSHHLKSVDRSLTPWLIVTIHRPLYESEDYEGDRIVTEHLRENIEDLLLRFEVDLVLGGHYHAYQRTCKVKNGNCVDVAGDSASYYTSSSGIIHVTVGSAGYRLDSAIFMEVPWHLKGLQQHGIGKISIDGGEGILKFEFIDTSSDEVLDKFIISKRIP